MAELPSTSAFAKYFFCPIEVGVTHLREDLNRSASERGAVSLFPLTSQRPREQRGLVGKRFESP